MTEHERDVFAHLANDWDAQAAEIERGHGMMHDDVKARMLREHATDLRGRLMALRAPVPDRGVQIGDGNVQPNTFIGF